MIWFFITSFVLSLCATPVIRQMALAQNLVAKPSTERWHKKPTALFGGAAIFLSAVFPLLFTADIATLPGYIMHSSNPFFVGYADVFLWFCMAYFFFLGLWDDLRPLTAHAKLLGQIIGAAAFAFAGFRLNWFDSLTLDTLVTMVWIVGIVNAFNLIDNMDGLCAGTGIIAALVFVLLLPSGSVAAACLAGALAGFLVFNFKPASIFMGDCGSLFMGFVLAAVSIHYSAAAADTRLYGILVPVLIFSVPILDTMMVSVVRLLSGRRASTGGKDHTSHRLVAMGFSEKEAVIILYAVSLGAGVIAYFVTRNDSLTIPAIVLPFALAVFVVCIYIAQIRIYQKKEFSVLREKKLARALTAAAFKWQSVFVVFDFFLVALSYYLAYRLRFDSPEFSKFFRVFLISLPVVIICKLAVFVFFDIYKSQWRHMGLMDILDYVKASFFGSIVSIAAVSFLFRFESFSKGVFVIDFLLTLGLLTAVRGSFRVFSHIRNSRDHGRIRVLIYGTGQKSELCIREMLTNPEWQMLPVGCVDPEPGTRGKKIYGVRVLGNAGDLDNLADMHDAAGIVVCTEQIEAEALDRLKRFCMKNGLFLKRFSVSVSDVDATFEE